MPVSDTVKQQEILPQVSNVVRGAKVGNAESEDTKAEGVDMTTLDTNSSWGRGEGTDIKN